MAARKANTYDVDGVSVQFNKPFMESWGGFKLSAKVQRIAADEDTPDYVKAEALLEYYERAIANFDEVVEALGGDDAPMSAILDTISKALEKMTPKN